MTASYLLRDRPLLHQNLRSRSNSFQSDQGRNQLSRKGRRSQSRSSPINVVWAPPRGERQNQLKFTGTYVRYGLKLRPWALIGLSNGRRFRLRCHIHKQSADSTNLGPSVELPSRIAYRFECDIPNCQNPSTSIQFRNRSVFLPH